ncbi:MAG: hypothetical protein KAT35_04985, partial [Candidatus Aenigmarchaeota archaeon]|nr:hypothetical protein [Candidatus Aenigmarchaeota archaeon]
NESIATVVYLPSTAVDLSFTLNYPPTGCSSNEGNSSGACGAAGTCVCDQVYIKTNLTDYSPWGGLANQNCTSPQGQTNVFAFLNLTLTGDVPANWTLELTSALPATLALIFNTTEDVGPDCLKTLKIPTTPSQIVVNESVQIGVSAFAWLYGNFTNAVVGTSQSDIESNTCQAIGGCS